MNRVPQHFVSAVVIVAVLGIGSVFARIYLAVPAYPPSFSHELTATGLVEDVRFIGLQKRYCSVRVAVYTWINLSPGFPLQAMPQEGDRYTLYAPRDTCFAVQVAAAGAQGHILYEAGEGASGTWYLTERPKPALSCGGRFNWRPPPV